MSVSVSRKLSVALFGLLLPLAALGPACTGGGETPDPGDGVPPTGDVPEAHPDDPLAVVLRQVGRPDVAPDTIVIRTGRDMVPPDLVGSDALDGTSLVIEPSIDGALRFTDTDELEFRPLQGFRPGTQYTAKLQSLQTLDGGPATPPAPDAWTTSFTTPDLGLVRIAPQRRDRLGRVAEVDLVFSAAVDAAAVAERLEITADGQRVRPARIQGGDAPHVVRVRLEGAAIAAEEVKLDVDLAPGLPWAWDAAVTAAAGHASVDLVDGKPVEIQAVIVKEGSSGHYIDVVCNDHSVSTTRWHWDRDTWDGWDVSTRCLLTEDSVSAVSLSTGGDVSIAQGPGGFRVFGDFSRGDVELRIDAGARTVDGGVMAESYAATLTIPARRSRLQLDASGRYLPRDRWSSLSLSHVNVDAVDVRVRHVPPANLAFWLSGGEDADSRTSDLVVEQRIALDGPDDRQATTAIDLAALVPDPGRGVYQVEVADVTGNAGAKARLLLTDMQLVAKRTELRPGEHLPREVQAWVLGAHDNKPVSGAEVQLLRPSGMPLATCRTGGDGGCLLAPPADAVDQTSPIAIVARKADDLTYLRFEDVPLRADADVSGKPYRVAAALRAAMWTDRGVYRPGDTAHVAALLRDDAHHAPDAGLPVLLKVYDPSRREIRRMALQSNAGGMVAADVPFADFATTGPWRVALEVGDSELGSATFAVEEFVPERMAVQVEGLPGPGGDGWLSTEPVPFQIDARWLFGGSAGDSRVEVTCQLRPGSFQPDGGTGQGRWSYGLTWLDRSRTATTDVAVIEEHLDAEGRLTVTCPAADKSGSVLGSAEMVARVAVFEGDSGRTTKEQAAVPVHPARHYLGLSTSRDEVSDGDVVEVKGKVVDWEGATVSGAVDSVQLRLYRMEEEYGWVYDEDQGDTVYRRMLRRVLEEERTVPVSGGAFQDKLTIPASAAGWLVDARAGGAHTERHMEGDASHWYWDPYDTWVDQTPKPTRPGLLALDLPAQADKGEQITVKTTAPYPGRMLLTVETDRVQHHQWKDVAAGPVELKLPLDVDDGDGGDFAPNVYVTALLLKDPHLESAQAYLPDRAYGVSSVRIRPKAYSHTVTVQAPEEVQPWSELSVKLKVEGQQGPTFATVAVVDEGILQLTDFETPDPRNEIFARRALGVDSFETIGWTLAREGKGPASHTGGDGGGGPAGRVQAIQPLALWSGVVEVPASGELDLSFDLPGYRGKLRVMAVTSDGSRMGSADAGVLVRDPIVLQTTLPRFLVAGDEARIPVRLTNMSGAQQAVTLDVRVESIDLGLPVLAGAQAPAVTLVDAPKQPIPLAIEASETALLTLRADRAPAAVKLIVTATSGKLTSREERQLPVANPEPELRRVTRVALTDGRNDLTSAMAGWKAGTDNSTVWVTTNPHAQALTGLSYLVRYPYGCIEQTTSSTRPLLYVQDLVERIDPSLVAEASVDEMIQAGIERVLSMQTPSGGMAYWPGGHSPNTFGTAYATHMLLDAKDAGHAVPPDALDDALDWLETRVGGRISGDNDIAYAHFVLARAGRARTAQALAVLEALETEAKSDDSRWQRQRRDEARYLLMAALYMGGDRRYADRLKKDLVVDQWDYRANDWSFWSALRGAGMRLAVYQDAVGVDATGDAAAERVATWVSSRSPRRWTTQELAWAVTALGRRAQAVPPPEGSKLLVDGKTVSGGDDGAWGLVGAAGAGPLTLDAGRLSGPTWALVSTRGVRTDEPVPMGGDGLALTRTFLDGQGRAVDPGKLTLGTALYVRVDLENTSNSRVQNLALVDRLPAGWEIENPRLGGADLPDWAQELDLWSLDHMNLRDDRVEVFGDLGSHDKRSVLYAVRAVTSGTFVQPPVSAEAMYDPDIWARRAGGTVTVVGPWDDGLL
ncbi:MAG: hypothetical protein H6742_02600 [Alphaproteobacteria bacterium]|nr:hypothetical protein [Alphaproteobacteria bacterium]